VPSGAGGGTDATIRILADHLARKWAQQVLVVNQAGAGGVVAVGAAGRSAPDGYTLYSAIASNFVVLPALQPKMPFDVAREFVPIGFIGEQPMAIAATSILGVNSLPELITLGKKRPGEINVAVFGQGGIPHLTGEWLRSASGTDMTIVHYSAFPQALTDLIAGRMQVIVQGLPVLAGSVASGALKLLAVGSANRLPNFPDLPTVAETLPGFLALGWFALMAPPGTPHAVAQKVSDDLRAVLATLELKQRFLEQGTYVQPMSPGELTAFIRSQQEIWKPVIAEVGRKSPK
jgi:tripartite-type tricarboxylate transporter receptor subunit TctC